MIATLAEDSSTIVLLVLKAESSAERARLLIALGVPREWLWICVMASSENRVSVRLASAIRPGEHRGALVTEPPYGWTDDPGLERHTDECTSRHGDADVCRVPGCPSAHCRGAAWSGP